MSLFLCHVFTTELGESVVFPVRMPPFLCDIAQLLCVVCGSSEVGKVWRAGGPNLIIFSKPCFSIVKDIPNHSLFRLLWILFPCQAS